MNVWKCAAKYWYRQFNLWVKAYNEIADKYMIDNTVGTSSDATTLFFREKP